MAVPSLEIIAGEVTAVQLSSEAIEDAPEAPRRGRHKPKERIINQMRIFVRDDAGKEDDYDFEESSVGVREGHRVVVVRASDKKVPKPVILVLHNLSNSEREEVEENFALFTDRPYVLSPAVVGFLWALGTFVLGFLASRFVVSPDKGMGWNIGWPLMAAILGFFGFWGLTVAWRAILRRSKSERGRNAIRAEIQGRLAAYAQPPQTAAAKG